MTAPPIILFQGPMNLDGYDRSLPASAQPSSVPLPFLECMSIREEVFVKEQGVPLLMEADSDDARSCHWVVYDRAPGQSLPEPVGTVRLVPFPHEPHPLPGSSWDIEESPDSGKLNSTSPPWIVDRKTTFHDGTEPYIKFGRLAVLKDFRGKGIAELLVRTAIKWSQENPGYLNATSSKKLGETVKGDGRTWKGLICVHAQVQVARAWAKWGFTIDEGMGTWTEAGIPHIGMFKRVDVSTKN